MLSDREDEPFLDQPSPPHKSQNDLLPMPTSSQFAKRASFSSRLNPILACVLVFVLTSLLWVSVLFLALPGQHHYHFTQKTMEPHHDEPSNITSNREFLLCHPSASKAKSNGCRYDILANTWFPTVCVDDEAIEEYQTDGSWTGFADEGRTQILSIEEMSQMEYYYTSERDHIVHCAMLWRKQFRAFFEGRTNIDTIIASEKHTIHCSQFLIDMTEKGPDYWNMPIKTWVGYGGCWSKRALHS
jgi:hypothetical protein